MLNWLFGKKEQPVAKVELKPRHSYFSTHALEAGRPLVKIGDVMSNLVRTLPKAQSVGAMDDSSGAVTVKIAAQNQANISDAVAMWYASQGFIGHQLCAILSQHWLINKACSMPGRDAIRNGYDIVAVDGDDLPKEAIKILNRADRQMKIKYNLEQFVRMGRIFGVRVALFQVNSTDPEYYEKPFNIDGVGPGSYKGIVQVDPYWCAPQLMGSSVSNPGTMHFYEPTYWLINGKKYHRSHLVIYRPHEVPDLIKPSYLYGGLPVTQLIMERVYAAERVANEAPELAETKRTTVWRTDMSAIAANPDKAVESLNNWVTYRDNYSVKLGDKDGDEFQQFDTSLADLDSVIMTQYQIVAAAANVPATKLLGTTPKGFNSSGDYEAKSYHEELESIQEHDLAPLLERHHALCMRSIVIPELGIDHVETSVAWRPVDSPTAQELAATNLAKAQIGQALVTSGAIDGQDERKRIAMDPTSGYHGVGADDESEDTQVAGLLDEIEQALNGSE
jgi:phage-related protein (TIGR01555 family)